MLWHNNIFIIILSGSIQTSLLDHGDVHIMPESNDPVATTITAPHVLESIAFSFFNSFSGQVAHLIEF